MRKGMTLLIILLLILVVTGCADKADINILEDDGPKQESPAKIYIYDEASSDRDEIVIKPTALEDITADYTLETAKREISVVYEDGDITAGQEVWDAFVSATENREPAVIRLVFYYSEDHLSDASIYPMDLTYSDNGYRLEHYEEGKLLVDEFPHMVKMTGKPNAEAIFSDYTYYVLVEDESVTWEMIFRGMVSSQMGDYIPHRRVYSDIVHKNPSMKANTESMDFIHPEGETIVTRFILPDGFERIEAEQDSFADYLRTLPLKPDGSKVEYYDGREKNRQNVYCAVVDMSVGDKDLQQCADAVMRLRGEYLYWNNQRDKIHFNLTNGFRMDYSKWMAGHRVKVNGNTTSWVQAASPSDNYESFLDYMEFVFIYAGSLSLSQELVTVTIEDMAIGDVLIVGGTPGHSVIVVDMAKNEQTGQKIYMLAQSYMPAQDIQVLMNPEDAFYSPWYVLGPGEKIRTPEWTFSKDDLMRFGEE